MVKKILLITSIFLVSCSSTPRIPLTPMQQFCKQTWREADRWVSSCIGSYSAQAHHACEYGREIALQNKQYYMELWITNDCASYPDPND